MARIRRDALVPEIRGTFERARTEPTLADVIAAARREELVCASATWAEAIADRGLSSVRRSFGAMLDHDDLERWHPRARRALLFHGLAPATEAVETVAEALQEAHVQRPLDAGAAEPWA